MRLSPIFSEGPSGAWSGLVSAPEQFAALPEPIQGQLLQLVRLVAGMDAKEKDEASLYCAALRHVEDMFPSTVDLLLAVEQLVLHGDRAARYRAGVGER
jgi:hypothetical protein